MPASVAIPAMSGVQAVVRPAQASVPATSLPMHTGMPTGMPGPPGGVDPIAEAPLAAWYVRPPAGGQYGPARGDVMRKWIGEGRVSSDSLVWREGWSDWRNAGVLFPSLGAPALNAGGSHDSISAGSLLGGPLGGAAISSLPAVPRSAAIKSRPSGSGMAVGIVIFLVLLCIGLVVALVLVLGGAK